MTCDILGFKLHNGDGFNTYDGVPFAKSSYDNHHVEMINLKNGTSNISIQYGIDCCLSFAYDINSDPHDQLVHFGSAYSKPPLLTVLCRNYALGSLPIFANQVTNRYFTVSKIRGLDSANEDPYGYFWLAIGQI